MKIGDLVMFNDEKSLYAQWFYGQLGIVEHYTPKSKSKNKQPRASCRVKWLTPVKYFKRYTTYSDFGAASFEVYKQEKVV